MKKPVVDYRQFRLSRLKEERFSHLLYLLGWVVYFVMYFITENFISTDRCYVVHGALDDVIPFCEYFVIPYVGWYFLICFTLIYFALYNPQNFKGFMKFIIFCQVTAMIIYIVFPNRQDLRPQSFENENIFTELVKLIYAFDTNTNVCPSMHVAFSLGIASSWLKEKDSSAVTRAVIVFLCILVCLSVVFVKQHSVVDIYAALPLCIFAEAFAYGAYWKDKFAGKNKN